MPKPANQKSKRIFLYLSLFILLIDIALVSVNIFQSHQTLVSSFQQDIKHLHTTFDIAFQKTLSNMVQIATLVANDPKIQYAFYQGKTAYRNANNDADHPDVQHARQQLLKIVAPGWREMTKQFKARQLHFHLAPGATSFLRVHKPAKYGDNLDDVRHTIVDANQYQKVTRGFETGRVYSGIRGVHPVIYTNPLDQIQYHIGAVESGISFHNILADVNQAYQVDGVILLNDAHIRENVWPDFIEKRLSKTPPFQQFIVEETTSNDYQQLLSADQVTTFYRNADLQIAIWNQQYYLISAMPLRDYLGDNNPDLPAVGKIVFWRDISPVYQQFFNNVKINFVYAIVGFIFVELILFFAIKKTTHRLETIIRKRTKILRASHQQLKKLSLAVQYSPSVIIITDTQGAIEYVNSKFSEITGFSESEVLGQSIKILSTGTTSVSEYEGLWKMLAKGKEWRGELLNKKKNGDLFWVNEYISPIFDSHSEITHYVAVLEDITEKRKVSENINYLATHDMLTGLINRCEFENRLNKILNAADIHKQHVLCFFDLDHFKTVNDSCGHPAGDELLKELTSLVKQHLRHRDTFARFGGDEFALLMENCSIRQARKNVEKIRAAIEQYRYNCKEKTFQVTASLGLTAFDPKTDNLSAIMERADKACYQAKNAGKNQTSIAQPNHSNMDQHSQ